MTREKIYDHGLDYSGLDYNGLDYKMLIQIT